MATKSSTKQREVTVLVRYQLKQDCLEKGLHKGDVVLLVENDQGVRYYTTLRRNKAHSCSCVGSAEHGRRCYHIKAMVTRENARAKAKKTLRIAAAMPPKCPVAAPVVLRVGDKVITAPTAIEAVQQAVSLVRSKKVETLAKAA